MSKTPRPYANLLKALVSVGCASTIGFGALGLSACQNATSPDDVTSTEQSDAGNEAGDTENAGPHADPDRELAAPEVRVTDSGVKVARLDLGNVTEKDFVAPVRGVVTLPKQPAKGLILINHLRAPNCGEEFAYPCPAGSTETRMDFGMEYLATALSEAGYATITPDLGPLWIGGEVTEPYNQQTMWQNALKLFFDELEAGVADIQIPAAVREHTGLFVHSRAGALVQPAVELLGQEHLQGVFAYAPSYDTLEYGDYSPAPIDVPYFGIASLEDRDVGPSANQWLSIYLDQQRSTPAEVALVPGLGHMLINEQLVQQGMDERIGCEEGVPCQDAEAHKALLEDVVPKWFEHVNSDNHEELFKESAVLGGDNVRWLRITPQASKKITPREMQAQRTDGTKQAACWIADPMDPAPIMPEGLDTCPMSDSGVLYVIGEVAIGQSLSAEVTPGTSAKKLTVHLAPFGSGQQLAPKLKVYFKDGSETTAELPATAPEIRDQTTEVSNGEYVLSSITVDIPEEYQYKEITKIELLGNAANVQGTGTVQGTGALQGAEGAQGELVIAGIDLS